MRISAGEIPGLPLCAALFDRAGGLVMATPEWRGQALGALVFEAGTGTLVVVPDGSSTDVDELVADLVGEVSLAATTLPRADRMAAEMAAAGLTLVAGRPPASSAAGGDATAVLEYALAGLRRSTHGLKAEAVVEENFPVASPAALALGVVQLARNAARHAGAGQVTLRALRGPTLRVEWPDTRGSSAPVNTARRPDQRARWGMGFARLLADSLGGVVTAPAPIAPGLMASAIGLGRNGLSAAVAVVAGRRVERATRAWDEDTGLPPGAEPDQRLLAALAAAEAMPGEVAHSDILRARTDGSRTWVAVAPQSSLGRARDVLRGLQHENALLTAPEPHATNIYALARIIDASVSGEPLDGVPPATWDRDFPAACRAVGLTAVPAVDRDRLSYPDPRVTAFVLRGLEGTLLMAPEVSVRAIPTRASSPIVRALGGRDGIVRLPA